MWIHFNLFWGRCGEGLSKKSHGHGEEGFENILVLAKPPHLDSHSLNQGGSPLPCWPPASTLRHPSNLSKSPAHLGWIPFSGASSAFRENHKLQITAFSALIPAHHVTCVLLLKSPKCSTWMQSQWQNDLCSVPRQTIQYHSNLSLCPGQ